MPREVKPELELYAEAPLPTEHGVFRISVFREAATGLEHVALVMGEIAGEGVLTRVHSECMTGEVFGSLKCDCKAQLDRALKAIAQRGAGVLVYLRQEGRGIGFGNKIRAYALQARGLDTYQANRELGFPDDLRRYDVAAAILIRLGVKSVALITNNPEKLSGLTEAGVPVIERVALPSPVTPFSFDYIEAKKKRTGHLIETDAMEKIVG